MGVSLALDERAQVLLVSFEGELDDSGLLAAFARVRLWMARNGPRSSISDFTGVTTMKVTAMGVGQLADAEPLVSDAMLRVVVAPRDNIYGMARMFEALGSATRDVVYIVRSYPEACALLRLAAPEFRTLECWE